MYQIAAFLVAGLLFGGAALFVALKGLPFHAAADPVERSNHVRPTPQIGGLALVPVFVVAMVALRLAGHAPPVFADAGFLAGIVVLYAAGLVDDRRGLAAMPKLGLQAIAAGLALLSLYDLIAAAPAPLALSLSLAAAFVGLLVVTNLANFIDGLDLMAVATVGVPSLSFALLAVAGTLAAGFIAPGALLAGLMLAFAFVNRPPAKAFLGDAGSQPFGLALGVMTVVVACAAGPFAALLLPAYLLCDGLVTIARRALAGDNVLVAHSVHVYQRAFRAGRPAMLVAAAAAAIGILAGAALSASAEAGIVWQAAAAVAVLCAWWFVSALLLRSPRA